MILKKQVFKFILVGVINTAFYYILYSTFIFLGLEYFYSVIIATLIGILFSFKNFSKYVFTKSQNKSKLLKFTFVYIVNIVLNIFIIKFYLFYNDNLYIAGAISTIFVATISFLLNKYYVFKV